MGQHARTARTLKKLTAAGADLADTAVKMSESAMAAGAVIGHRVVMGAQALQDPTTIDHAELTLMTTEKIEAFTASSHAVLNELQDINRELVKFTVGQAAGCFKAAWEVATAHSPIHALEAQRRWMVEAWARANAHTMRMTTLSAGVSALALAPVHETVTDNARRLARRALDGEE
jgi:hypothetical protein